MVADLDIAPERLATGGYVCRLCEADAREIYPTRASIWIEHGFESLLEWSNERFRADLQVMLFQTADGGSTWVEFRWRSDGTSVGARSNVVAEYPLLCGSFLESPYGYSDTGR